MENKMEKKRVQIWKGQEGQIFLAPWDPIVFRVSDGYLVFRYTEVQENELFEYEKKNLGVAVTLSTRTKEQLLSLLADQGRKSVFYFSKEIPQMQ